MTSQMNELYVEAVIRSIAMTRRDLARLEKKVDALLGKLEAHPDLSFPKGAYVKPLDEIIDMCEWVLGDKDVIVKSLRSRHRC